MVKTVLVTVTLSEEMIKAGRYLLEELDKKQLEIKSCFWLFLHEEKTWNLIIASDIVEKKGSKYLYKIVININRENNRKTISLNDIVVTGLKKDIIHLLGVMINTGDTISGMRFSRNTINGVYIEDAYIYRSNL